MNTLLEEERRRLVKLEGLYKRRTRKGIPPSSFAEELGRTGLKKNHQYFPSGYSGDREGLWDITQDTPDPHEKRLEGYEISDHS